VGAPVDTPYGDGKVGVWTNHRTNKQLSNKVFSDRVGKGVRLIIKSMAQHIHEEREEKETQRREWAKHHYGTVARWVKEVALLSLASLVVQRLLAGGSLADPVVLLGVITTAILYATAIHLLLKS
jgi:hypothetical protein